MIACLAFVKHSVEREKFLDSVVWRIRHTGAVGAEGLQPHIAFTSV